MTQYVVTAGLTARLVDAETEHDAKRQFLITMPRGRFYGRAVDGDLEVHEATELEVAGFLAGRRRARPPETLELDGMPPRQRRKANSE